MGWQWECGGHENSVKTRSIGGVNFNLKGGSRPGPTKLSITLSAEGSHKGAMPTTVHKMISPLITNNQLNSWFDFFNSILLIPGWIKLAEPNKVRLDIDLGVPDKPMFTQPLLGPGC